MARSDMHVPHRAAGAQHPQVPTLAESGPDRRIGSSNIRSRAADVGDVIVMQAAHIYRGRGGQRLVRDQVEDAAPLEQAGRGGNQVCRRRPQQDDIVGALGDDLQAPSGKRRRVQPVAFGDRDAQLSGFPFQPFGQGGWDVAQEDAGRVGSRFQAARQPVFLASGSGRPNHPGCPARLQRGAVIQVIGGVDTCPGLGEGGFGIAGFLLHRKQVAAPVASQNFVPQHGILRKPALESVTISHIAPVEKDIGLEGIALAGFELLLQVGADAHHGDRKLMPQHNRLAGQIPAGDARVGAADLDHLDVRKAQAARVVPDQ